MNYKEALEEMKKGYVVRKGYGLYYIPSDKPKTEENIRFYPIDKFGSNVSDLDSWDKENGNFEKL